MMLLAKIKVVTTMLLVVSALAAGGSGFVYRAQAEGPRPGKLPPNGTAGERTDDDRTGMPVADTDGLRGSWRTVSGERFGESLSKEMDGWTDEVVFDQNTITWRRSEVEDAVNNFKINSDKKPKEIDFDDDKPAIYELSGDDLKICFNIPLPGQKSSANRPTKLAGTGPHRVLLVLKRVK